MKRSPLILALSLIYTSSLLGCEDETARGGREPTFTIESRHYVFPAPSFDSQSSSVEFLLENRGASPLRVTDVIYREMDDQPEVSLLDEDDWRSGQLEIVRGGSRRVRFSWNVADLTPDWVNVEFQTNIGVQRITLETPEIEAQMRVTAPPEPAALASGAELALNEVIVGGAARAQVRIQSGGLVSLDVSAVCFLDADDQCVVADQSSINQIGSFHLCDGTSETLGACRPLPELGTLLSGATQTLSVFYAPLEPRVEPERVRLLIRNNTVEAPEYTLTFTGLPCVRSEQTPVCGGCGDGVISGAEECDDGNLVSEDACLNSCVKATCGDGVVQSGVEACDDGNESDEDACTNSCELAVCGDGIQRLDLTPEDEGYEACDDGNSDQGDACLDGCVKATCGDGAVQRGVEACDDGNESDADACTNNCELAICGDGIQRLDLAPDDEGYEACDDGNDDQQDACTSGCEAAVCGDGIQRLDLMPGEEGYEACDDGNDDDSDECTALCAPPLAVPGCAAACQTWNQTLAQIEPEVVWSGSLAMCDPGELEMSSAQRVEALLNLHRGLVLESPISLSQAQAPALQECALMMDANDQLSSAPPAEWSCHSGAGAAIAGQSLLTHANALDAVSINLIDAAHPLTLENRLRLLAPRLEQLGVGSTEQYSCLHPTESNRALRYTDWGAYPRGCFPLSAFSDAQGNHIDDVGWTVTLAPETAINGDAEVSVTRHTVESISDPNGPELEPLEVEVSYLQPERGSAVLLLKPQGWRTEEGYIYQIEIEQMNFTMQSRIWYNLIPIRCSR